MKGEIHNSTGTICKAEISCPLGEDGHSANIEEFVEANVKEHGYDKEMLLSYAKEGMPPKEILSLAREEVPVVASIASVDPKIARDAVDGFNPSTSGLSDEEVKAGLDEVERELLELSEENKELFLRYDEASKKGGEISRALYSHRENIHKVSREFADDLSKALQEEGVPILEAYNAGAKKISNAGYYISAKIPEPLPPINTADFASNSEKVQRGISNFFNDNWEKVANFNMEVMGYNGALAENRDNSNELHEIFSDKENISAITKRRKLRSEHKLLKEDYENRKSAREAGVRTNYLDRYSSDARRVLADEKGEFKNFFVKTEAGEWRRIVRFDEGEYMQNQAGLIDDQGVKYSTVRGVRGPKVHFLIDETISGEPIKERDFSRFLEHD